MDNREKGRKSEDFAVKLLEDKGFKIVKRNFYFGKVGEIDIVAEDKQTLVFVEVRSKLNSLTPDPIYSLKSGKLKSLRKAAEGYLHVNQISDKEIRFDVIILDFTQNPISVNHLINAF